MKTLAAAVLTVARATSAGSWPYRADNPRCGFTAFAACPHEGPGIGPERRGQD